LHGVPIAVRTCATHRGHRDRSQDGDPQNCAERDATVVSRLKAAGAVLLGKLQLATEGAFSTHHPRSSRR
jgi:amidase